MEWVARTCCYCCFTYIVQEIFAYQRLFILLGVRSLANASRARQFNPLNPLGWGGYRFLKQIWQPWSVVRGRSCVVVRGRAWPCAVVRGRSCVVGHSWSCVVVHGRSCVVVPFCPLRGQHGSQHCRAARFAASTAVTRTKEGTNERTTYNNPLNPPGVGWVNFFYPIKVRVSMGTCVPNLRAIRRPVRKFCLSNL